MFSVFKNYSTVFHRGHTILYYHLQHTKVLFSLLPQPSVSSFINCYYYSHPCRCGGEGNGTPLQYSCLENPMDRGAWKAAVYWDIEGWTRLSYFTFTFHFPALEKEMATHSSVLAWRTPGMVEPGGLPSMGSHRVRHDWSDSAAAAAVGVDSFCFDLHFFNA